jgi:succinate dehydrogenase / fumarate reductase cytochrome b subunit
MQTSERPLSPHLQIYRWQLTMTLSIAHRATGIALTVGTLLLVWWLVAAAAGPEAYATAAGFMRSWLGILLLIGWSFSLFYHLCAGIRHLVWDTGYGLDIKSVYQSGWTVVIASLGLTLLAWAAALAQLGRG